MQVLPAIAVQNSMPKCMRAVQEHTHTRTLCILTIHQIMQMVTTRHDWLASNMAFVKMLAFCTDRIFGACRFGDVPCQGHNVPNLLLTEICTVTSTTSYLYCSNLCDILCKQTCSRLPAADTIMRNDPALDACLLISTGV